MKRIFFALLLLLAVADVALANVEIYKDEATAARRRIPFVLVDATDGLTVETGITFSAGEIKCSKSGGSEANHAGTITEQAAGDYYYEATTGEVDTAGYFRCRLTKSGVRTTWIVANIMPHPLNDAAPASPTTDSAWYSLKTLTGPDGTAQGGAAGTVDLATTASSVDDYYNHNTTVALLQGTGAGQNRCITDYVGSSRRATTLSSWVTNPDNTSKYILIATPNCSGVATSVSVAAGGITAASFATGAIDNAAIAADAIGASEIAADAIGASEVAANTLTTSEIADGALTAAKHATGFITSSSFASGAITSASFAGGAINAAAVNTDIKGATYSSSTDTLEQIRDNLGVNVTLANDAVSAAKLATDAAQEIADTTLRRSNANIEASSFGDALDFQSLYGAIAKQTNNISVSGNTLTIKKADGATTFDTQALTTTPGASPVTGVATN